MKRHGDRGEPYVFKDNLSGKHIIMVEETRYDAHYDTYYSMVIVINPDPTPAELFKVKLANPNG